MFFTTAEMYGNQFKPSVRKKYEDVLDNTGYGAIQLSNFWS